MLLNRKSKKGFTLVELIIVMTIIVVVIGVSLSSLGGSQALQVFNNNFDKIMSMISNARSQAISGKGQLDYTDFDHDGSSTDFVTPAYYGVNLNTSAPARLILFADINPPATGAAGQKGRYDAGTTYAIGHDFVLETYNLASNLTLEISDGATTYTSGSVFFSPNYADISFETLTASPFLTFKLRDTKSTRCRIISIHKLAGVPEIKQCP